MNRINAYTNGFVNPYQRATQAREAQASQPTQAPASTQATAPTHASAQAQASGPALTSAEQQMIDRQFPPKPAMSLRLYGPGQQAQSLNPNALGTRLDLRG